MSAPRPIGWPPVIARRAVDPQADLLRGLVPPQKDPEIRQIEDQLGADTDAATLERELAEAYARERFTLLACEIPAGAYDGAF